MEKKNTKLLALRAAFAYTIPVLTGYGFLGFAYGVYANVSGFSFLYPLIMSLVIYGGSLEFLTVSMLLSTFAPLQTFLAALMIQARHLFYGIAMLEKYKGMGWKRFFLIFGMSDETFSVIYTAKVPENVDRGWFMLFITLLDQFYWVAAATLGGLFGSLISFSTEGLDFVMTAMFVVIFLEQWLKERKHYTALIGLGASALCLYIFGADSFLIPSMICILAALSALRKPIEKAGGLG